MTGKELHKILKDNNINFAELARSLDLSAQSLNSRFNSKDVTVGFLQDILKNINISLYDLKGIELAKPKKYLEQRVEELEERIKKLENKI